MDELEKPMDCLTDDSISVFADTFCGEHFLSPEALEKWTMTEKRRVLYQEEAEALRDYYDCERIGGA